MAQELIQYLSQFVSEQRFSTLRNVLEERTRYITVVLEDIYQSQNASAVLRSCECFGIQDVHAIENRNSFTVDTEVSMGSNKWINLFKYREYPNNTLPTLNSLRKKGYRIVATTPHINETLLDDFDLKKGKIALVFGTERKGISDIVRENADEFLKIPMLGFTESFNISVSAAILLYQLSRKLRTDNINWKLSDPEKEAILTEWLRKSIRRSDLIMKKYSAEQET